MDSEIVKYYTELQQKDLDNIINNSTINYKDPKMVQQVTNHLKRISSKKFINIDWEKVTKLKKIDFINKALKKTGKKNPSYLEIGVYKNENFNLVETSTKLSVDPDKNAFPTFLGTSNEFFRDNKIMFDVILIDGLHTYEQCQEDAINSLKHLNKNGYIFFHDFIPRNFLEEYVPRISGAWTGDVWKVSVELAQTKGINFKVVMADHGVGFLKKIDDEVKYHDKNRKELLYKKYEDFFELNRIVEYQNAEKAFNEFI